MARKLEGGIEVSKPRKERGSDNAAKLNDWISGWPISTFSPINR